MTICIKSPPFLFLPEPTLGVDLNRAKAGDMKELPSPSQLHSTASYNHSFNTAPFQIHSFLFFYKIFDKNQEILLSAATDMKVVSSFSVTQNLLTTPPGHLASPIPLTLPGKGRGF